MSYTAPSVLDRYQRNGLIMGAAGLILLLVGLFVGPVDQFFHSYMLGFLCFMSLTVGSLGMLMLQHLTGGAWGVLTRRMYEASTRLLPLTAILFIPVIVWMSHIFMWTTSNPISALPIVQAKSGYLNVPFFIIRAVVYFVFWTLTAALLNRYSLKQDETRDPWLSRKLENFSGGGLLFFGLVMTFASVDWIMSLAPEWYSTMFPFIVIVGQAMTVLTFVIIMIVLLSKTEPMASVIKPVHLHDLGKLLFAFNFLWGYLVFCQFLITYSGNLPEEIEWYHFRIAGGWEYVIYAVIFLHFALPFLLLLSRDLKRSGKTLIVVAAWLFVMRIVDLYWLVEPNWHRSTFFLSWMDIIAVIGFLGLFLYLFVWQYKKRFILPVGEPELELALHPKGAH